MQQCLPGEAKWIHGALPPKRTDDSLCGTVLCFLRRYFYFHIRQNVQQKPADELKGGKGHPFGPVSIGRVPVAKRDRIAFQPFDPLIADGHPMRIPSRIRQDVLRTAKGRPAIGDLFFPSQVGDEGVKPGGGFPRRDLSCADRSCPTTA